MEFFIPKRTVSSRKTEGKIVNRYQISRGKDGFVLSIHPDKRAKVIDSFFDMPIVIAR